KRVERLLLRSRLSEEWKVLHNTHRGPLASRLQRSRQYELSRLENCGLHDNSADHDSWTVAERGSPDRVDRHEHLVCGLRRHCARSDAGATQYPRSPDG